MSQEEAEAAADKRIKNEKRALIGTGVTLAAAGTYLAARHYIQENVDQVLKEGTTMQRVARGDKENATLKEGRAIYLAWGRHDTRKYEGLLAPELKTKYNNPVKLKIGAKSDLKVASPKSAKNAFNELMNTDSEFRNWFNKRYRYGIPGQIGKQADTFNRAANAIQRGKTNNGRGLKNAYEAFNIGLVDHSPESQKQINKFYNTLKQKGYAGVADINDRKKSGYNTKTATIMFDTAKLSVKSAKEMTDASLDKARKREVGKNLVKAIGTTAVSYTVPIVGISHLSTRAIINNYVKNHPNTKLTDKEIIDMYNRKRT